MQLGLRLRGQVLATACACGPLSFAWQVVMASLQSHYSSAGYVSDNVTAIHKPNVEPLGWCLLVLAIHTCSLSQAFANSCKLLLIWCAGTW